MSSKLPYGLQMPLNAPDYLDRNHFLMTLGVAMLLHLVAVGIWMASPRSQMEDVPVRVLNIKLGDDDTAEADTPQQGEANNNGVENALSLAMDKEDDSVVGSMEKAMKDLSRQAAPKALDQAIAATGGAASAAVQESARKLSDAARQFVRANSAQAKEAGSSLGNSEKKNAEMVSRYEQLISLWIQKFKLYPDDARAAGMQGDTVVRIRIDRQGNIRYYILENSTGYQPLDRAAIDMIRRANPVPAVPNDYPPGELIEFLIPVSFHLQ